MTSFINQLIHIIRQYRLQDKSPSQLKSSIDWQQVLFMAEHNMLSERMARNYLYLSEQDIEFLKDFPDFLHRLPSCEQLYKDLLPHVRLGCLAGNRDIEFGVRFDRPTFITLSGLTGCGKSNTLRVLLKEIYRYNKKFPEKAISVIVFNRKGTDFADLPEQFGWKHYHVFKTLRMSLENPPAIAPMVWANIIASNFCARAQLMFAWTTLVAVISTLLGLLNPNPAKRLIWPDFQLILDFLNMLPDTLFSTKAEYTRALKQKLQAICISTTDIFRAFQGFQAESLIQNGESAIITMPNLKPDWVRQFITDLVINQVLKPRMELLQAEDQVRILFVIEEADSDVDSDIERYFTDGMTPISEVFKKGRAFSVGGCVSVSSLLRISSLIRENTTTHMIFKPSDSVAAMAAAQTLMLADMGERTLDHLGIGQCIAKQIGPWPHAIKVDIDHMPFSQFSTDYDSHEFMPALPITEIPAVMDFIKKVRQKRSHSTDKKPTPVENKARKILQLAADNPYVPVMFLFDTIGNPHHKTQKAIRSFIEERKWAKFAEPRIGRKNLLLIELTETGYKAVNKQIPDQNKGRGGITHRHYAHWIMLFYVQKGFKSFIELVLPGTNHPVDVAVENGCHLDVFEISVSSSENVISHIKTGFSCEQVRKLTLVTGTAKEQKELKNKLKNELILMNYADRLKFEVIEKYIIERT